jgi:hypothetical protein
VSQSEATRSKNSWTPLADKLMSRSSYFVGVGI